MACVTVFTWYVFVANTTATGSLLSALIQLLLLIRSLLSFAVITITILKRKYLQTTTITKNRNYNNTAYENVLRTSRFVCPSVSVFLYIWECRNLNSWRRISTSLSALIACPRDTKELVNFWERSGSSYGCTNRKTMDNTRIFDCRRKKLWWTYVNCTASFAC